MSNWNECPKCGAASAVHIAEGDTPIMPDYAYDSTGLGVRKDLIDAVLAKWATANPYGDPAGTLAAVNQGALNQVGNIARMAVAAALKQLSQANQAGELEMSNWNECPKCGAAYDTPEDARKCCGP